MTLAHHYPEFGTPARPGTVAIPDAATSDEEDRLAQFDAGFQVGWEDATAAIRTEADKAVLGISQRLQDMSFTFEEARSKVFQAQVPVLTRMMGKMLPETAKASLGSVLDQEMAAILTDALNESVVISVSPEAVDTVQGCLKSLQTRPFSITPDATLEPGQILLSAGTKEREINLDDLVGKMNDGLQAFLNATTKARANV